MYAAFFGLREPPFNNTPDPRFFHTTPEHEEALASLIYAVQERKGFVLLTGEVGAGKTLVSRMMLRHFGNQIVFAHIHHAVTSADDLMEAVCQEFELDAEPRASRTQRVRLLHDFLLQQFSRNTPAVLVLDEAQNLHADAFEQLRMIGNLEADDAKLLQVVIVGQPELRQILASKQLLQLCQRIFRGFHLPEMNRASTEAYIRHRLSVAGAEAGEIFDGSAMEIIYRRSRGLPRVINGICDNALLSAYAADRRHIDGPFVEMVIRQMMLDHALADQESAPPMARPLEYRMTGTPSGPAPIQGAPSPQDPNLVLAAHRYGHLAQRAADIEHRILRSKAKFKGADLSKAMDALQSRNAKEDVVTGLAVTAVELRVADACRRLGNLRRRFLSDRSDEVIGVH